MGHIAAVFMPSVEGVPVSGMKKCVLLQQENVRKK
jgi:hypothetical protein